MTTESTIGHYEFSSRQNEAMTLRKWRDGPHTVGYELDRSVIYANDQARTLLSRKIYAPNNEAAARLDFIEAVVRGPVCQ